MVVIPPKNARSYDHCFVLTIIGDLKPEADVELTIGLFIITPDLFSDHKRTATRKIVVFDDDMYGKLEIQIFL